MSAVRQLSYSSRREAIATRMAGMIIRLRQRWRRERPTLVHSALLITVALLLVACACRVSTWAGDEATDDKIAPGPVKSHTGRFFVFGSDSLLKLTLLRWAEEVTGRLERLLGFKLSFDNRKVRIVVREEPDIDSGFLGAHWSVVGSTVFQQLTISNYEMIDRETADEALCRLLLRGHVREQKSAQARPSRPPAWLSVGLAQNLYAGVRARNSRLVLDQWQSGRLPTVPAFLGRDEPGTGAVYRATCGLFAGWLMSAPGKAERFEKIFDTLAGGEAITTQWLTANMPGCNTVMDLDEEWDRWILRQKRIVYEPGTVFLEQVQQLKAELLLYPGFSDIPLMGDLERPITFRELIPERGKPWLVGFVKPKAARLRVLGVGRDKAFGDVIEAYCRFLEALPETGKAGSLEKLLNEAERSLRQLEHQIKTRARNEDPGSQGPGWPAER
jgi:hypothetical protein